MSRLREEVLAMRRPYDEEPPHSDHVAFLALQLFDGLTDWHRLGLRGRELLEAAALLHDIGWSQCPNGRGHHKESARLIREHVWENLEPAEAAVVAQITRYHRKALPKPSHADFQALSLTDQERVMTLGGILRLADALDRTHRQLIEGVSIDLSENFIGVRLRTKEPCVAEREMFNAKADLLRLAAGRAVSCR